MGTLTDVVRRMVTWRGGSIQCAGCGRTKHDDVRFVSGPHVYICSVCRPDAGARFAASALERVYGEACSFCGKSEPGVPLEAHAHHVICGDCILLVERILAEDEARRPGR